MNKDPKDSKMYYKACCWLCGEERKLLRYYAAGGVLYLCMRCAGISKEGNKLKTL